MRYPPNLQPAADKLSALRALARQEIDDADEYRDSCRAALEGAIARRLAAHEAMKEIGRKISALSRQAREQAERAREVIARIRREGVK